MPTLNGFPDITIHPYFFLFHHCCQPKQHCCQSMNTNETLFRIIMRENGPRNIPNNLHKIEMTGNVTEFSSGDGVDKIMWPKITSPVEAAWNWRIELSQIEFSPECTALKSWNLSRKKVFCRFCRIVGNPYIAWSSSRRIYDSRCSLNINIPSADSSENLILIFYRIFNICLLHRKIP